MKLIFFITICLTTIVCGCSPHTALKTPAPPNTEFYTSEDHLLNTDQRIAIGNKLAVEWWSLFENETLNNTIRQATTGNYDLISATRTLQQAEEAVKLTNGGLWPQVSLLGAAGRQKYGVALFGPATFKIPPFTYYEIGPSVNWTPDFFGKTRYSIEQQLALMQYQAHNLDAVYIALTSNVVTQALEIATVKAEIAATKNIITEDEKTLQLINKAFAIGARTKADILNAQSQLESDKAFLPTLQQRLGIAKHALAILVGKAPANWTPPNFEIDNFVLPHELPVSLPSELVRKRPDILAAEANLNAANAAIGVATANLYPNLVLSANTLQESLTPHGLFLGINNAWAMAANLTAPLFNGGTLRAQKRMAEQAYQATLAQYQQTILVAFQQVADALTLLANDADAIAAEQKTVDISKASLKMSYESFAAGSIGLLQIQDQQRTLARAQLNLIQAQSQRYLDTIKLFVALGGSPLTNANTETTLICSPN